MDSYNRVNQVEFKVQVKRDFINQEVAYRWQSNFYNEKNTEFDNPHVWDYYPEFFEKEKKHSEEEQKAMELEQLKGNRKKYAAEYKRRQGRE